jgi:hypothetical protein
MTWHSVTPDNPTRSKQAERVQILSRAESGAGITGAEVIASLFGLATLGMALWVQPV